MNVLITDRAVFEPLLTGWEIARQLAILYPADWNIDGYDRLLADKKVLAKIRTGASTSEIVASYQNELREFLQRREKYLLY